MGANPNYAHYVMNVDKELLDEFRAYSQLHRISMADLLRNHMKTLIRQRATESARGHKEPRLKRGLRR